MRQCEIYLHGVKCGVLTEDDKFEFTFEYDKDYLLSGNAEPVSLTLPLQKEPFKSPYLFPAFGNMLSEGENRMVQSQLLRIDPEDDFGIMLATCMLDTVGAITVKPIGQ
ncbi:MAG: HipA N-terminal domain-containing protein [Candidatus Cryptobacteroides sp.]